MIRSSLQLLARRTLARMQLLSAVVIGVLLAATILAGSVIYTDSLKDLAVQHALEPSSATGVDLLLTASFGPLTPESEEAILAAVDSQIGPVIEGHGAPLGFATRSATFLPPSDLAYGTGHAEPDPAGAGRIWLGTDSAFAARISYVDGGPPGLFTTGQKVDAPNAPDAPDEQDEPIFIEVAIERADAIRLSASAGSTFDIFPGWISERERIGVVVTGVYERIDPEADFWRLYDEGLESGSVLLQTTGLLVDKSALADLAESALPGMEARFAWLYDIQTEGLTPEQGRSLVDRLDAERRFLAGTLDDYAQTTELPAVISGVTESVTLNTVPMSVVLVLVIIVVLYYVAVIAGLLVDAQSTEIGLLASRGATRLQVLIVYALEAAFLALAAAIAAPFIALGVVASIGLLPWFSDLNGGGALPVRLTTRAFEMSGVGGLLILIALTFPALKASRLGLVNQLRALARPPLLNLVQRYYLDLVFVGVVVYLFWQLSNNGSFLADRLFGGSKVDQLILAVPAMVMVAIAIVVVRLFPVATALLARLFSSGAARRFVPAALLLALWEMARNPAHHARFSLLIMLTAGLGVFAASFSATLAQSFKDRALYESGADVRLTAVRPEAEGASISIADAARKLDRVDSSTAAFRTQGAVLDVREVNSFDLLAVDAASLRGVAWLRPDFDAARTPALLDSISGAGAGGLELPADAARFNARVRPTRIPNGITAITARARDANERFFTLELGFLAGAGIPSELPRALAVDRESFCSPDPDGWCNFSADLVNVQIDGGRQFRPAPPVSIYSIGISRSARLRFSGPVQPAALDMDSLSVTSPDGEVTVIDDFEDPSLWHPLHTSPGSRGDLMRVAEVDGRITPGIARFAWTRSQANEFRGIGRGPVPEPARVLVSRTFLEEFGFETGDRITISSGNTPLDVRIAGVLDFFPTLNPDVRPFVIADLNDIMARSNVAQIGTDIRPDEVWLTSNLTASEIGDALPLRFFQSVERSELLSRVEIDPLLSAGWRALLAVSFFTVLAVSAIGFLVHARVTFQARARDFALLRTVGLSIRQLLSLVLIEHLAVIGLAVAMGAITGARLGSTIMPYLANTGAGVDVVPPMVLRIDWSSFALAFGLLGGVLALVIASIVYAVYRMSIHSAMRLGD